MTTKTMTKPAKRKGKSDKSKNAEYAKIGRAFSRTITEARKSGDVEKSVESAINRMLNDFLGVYYDDPVSNTHPYNTDGLVFTENLFDSRSVLIEAKRDMNLSGKRSDVAQVLCQCVYYMRKFVDDGEHVPDAVVVVDSDEIFTLNAAVLHPYLSREWAQDESWSAPPSTAHLRNTDLYDALMDDHNVRPYVYDMSSETFDPVVFCRNVHAMMENAEPEKIAITAPNLDKHFTEFASNVFVRGVQDVSNQKQIEIFMRYLRGDEDIYLHPKKTNTIVVENKDIAGVDTEFFNSYWSRFDSGNYSGAEIKSLVEICDTLIVEIDRRYTGDFWTPKIWVDRAHEMIAGDLGESWRDDYVVWDPAAGAKNLTRDYRFDRLYSSTLHAEELSLSSDYNTEGEAFAYDFLNDDIEMLSMSREDIEMAVESAEEDGRQAFSMPNELVRSLLDKEPFVFFANPPYGQATDQDGAKKGGIATTAVGEAMGKGYAHARSELYTQFFWRVMRMREIFEYGDDEKMHIFFFSNKSFLPSPSYEKFTGELMDAFACNDGFVINAGEFSGTSSMWGILFSHWSNAGSDHTRQTDLSFDVLISTSDLSVKNISSWNPKIVTKGNTISDWLAEIPLSKEKDSGFPLTKNGFDAPTANRLCIPNKGWIGYMHNGSSNVQFSDKYTGLYSMGFASKCGRDVTRDNFTRIAITFSIRRSVQEKISGDNELWIKDKDVFTKPSASLITSEFTADCMVYALFDRQSKQTSLRHYDDGEGVHRVVNEFYPFSREETMEWAEEVAKDKSIQGNAIEIESDATGDTDRFMYTWLTEHKGDISEEAQSLLDIVKGLYKDSMRHRKPFFASHPRYGTTSWDAGWIQISRMIFGTERCTDAFTDDRKDAFTAARAALGTKIADKAIAAKVI